MSLPPDSPQNQNIPANRPGSSPQNQDCASPFIFGLLWLWICLTIVLRFGIEIAASLIVPDTTGSRLAYLPLIQGLAILTPSLLLAFFWKNQAYRSIFRLWAWGSAYILWLIPVQLNRSVTIQSQAAWNLVLNLLFLALLVSVNRKTLKTGLVRPAVDHRFLLGLVITGTLALPWMAWGALGSPLDTILQLANGLAFGAAAALLVEGALITAKQQIIAKPPANTFWTGFSIATMLAILVSGLGLRFGVMQAFLILMLIPLAWVWIGLRKFYDRHEQPRLTMANFLFPVTLIGLAVAIPNMLVDSNELALITSMTPGDILQWSFLAARISALIGLAWAIAINIAVLRLRAAAAVAPPTDQSPVSDRKSSKRLVAAAAVLVWLVGVGVYLKVGQPGFFGDRMFVILKGSANLEAAVKIADYAHRRQFVYQSLVEHADTSQASIRQALDRLRISYQPYYLVNAIEVANNPLLRLWLKNRPDVDRIVDSPRLRPLAQTPPEMIGNEEKPTQPEWNITQIGAERVWMEFKIQGQGVIVGQSDSGVQWDHPDLQDTYRGKDGNHVYNWLDPWNAAPVPLDLNGHGTHTLGTILGQNTGIAPKATWIACANLSRNLGNPALYLDCLQFMLAPYPQGGNPLKDGKAASGAMVLNNSWGCPALEGCDSNTLLDAAKALRQAGVFVVASAGNEGPACSSVTDPLAIYSQVFSVGAIDQAGELASFSSLGPVTEDGSARIKPDLVAPGVDILSTFPGGTYATESGTSMAGPHVVGVVALIWSANPGLIGDIERTELILQQSAQPYTGALPSCTGAQLNPSTAAGYGVIDAYAAVKLALSMP